MKKALLLWVLCALFVFSSCNYQKSVAYYSEKNNYISASGTVTHIKYNDERDALYLGFDNLTPDFSDNMFKIVGQNLLIVENNDLQHKLKIGKEVEFISAPRYFGDGYVMPIVGLTIDGEILLEFEQGYNNWVKWIREKG